MISRRNGEASTVVGPFGGWTLSGESEELRNFVPLAIPTGFYHMLAPAASNLEFIFFFGSVMMCCCG
jgi:hypothetical protein